MAGFVPTITSRFYDGYPLPCYTFDKLNIGLIDAHAFAGDRTALRVLDGVTDAALPHLPEKALTRPEMAARPHANVAFAWDEPYTLPENLYLAWRRVQATATVRSPGVFCSIGTISTRSPMVRTSCRASTPTAI